MCVWGGEPGVQCVCVGRIENDCAKHCDRFSRLWVPAIKHDAQKTRQQEQTDDVLTHLQQGVCLFVSPTSLRMSAKRLQLLSSATDSSELVFIFLYCYERPYLTQQPKYF